MEFIEEPIHNSHKYYYIPTIDTLVFHLAHVHILGKNECISTIKEAKRSHQKYRYIKLGKYYPKNIVIQHLSKSNHSTGGMNTNYHWKVLTWTTLIILSLLDIITHHLNFIHTSSKIKICINLTHIHI